MHRLLRRQLRHLAIDPEAQTYDKQTFERLLALVSRSYEEDDERIALIQRSLKVSSREMRTMYKELERLSEEWTEAVLKAIPDLMFLLDVDGNFINVYDEGKTAMLHLSKEEAVGKNLYDLFAKKQADAFSVLIKRAVESSGLQSLRFDLVAAGNKRFFEARAVPVTSDEKGLQSVIVIVRDISDQRKMEQNAQLLSTVFSEATEGVMIEDEHREVVFVNAAMQEILGMSEAECLGKHSQFFNTLIPDETTEQIYAAMPESGHWHGETSLHRLDGKTLLVWLSLDALMDAGGHLSNVVVMATDISELHLSRERLQYLATHDTLTGLPNRALFFDRLTHSVAALKREEKSGALLFVDLDNFKDINDNFGHNAGDAVLKESANRIRNVLRASDTVGRFGGDEFVVIAESLPDLDGALQIAQKIHNAFEIPFDVQGNEIVITASIGIAMIPKDGDDPEMLINAADRAMYIAKERGRNGIEFYAKDYSLLSHEYFRIQRIVRLAVRAKRFEVRYQPQWSLIDGAFIGVEALLHCLDERIADVPTERIIMIAEENDLINDITKIVLGDVGKRLKQWREISPPGFIAAVNLSRRELGSEHLAALVDDLVAGGHLDPYRIEFEITESTLMQSRVVARQNIEHLRAIGCRFSIDDFGTGYSSLSNLKEFNLDKLKIDRSFIEGIETNQDDRIIVEATVSMAKKLGLHVLAEGVEKKGQAELLREIGCDEAQGFFFSPPVDAGSIHALMRDSAGR